MGMLQGEMAGASVKPNSSESPFSKRRVNEEDEVYGVLGALLGTLEVVRADETRPLAPVQHDRLRAASRLGRRLQHQIEALLILATDDFEARLRCQRVSVRALIEHAVRGAIRGFEPDAVAVTFPDASTWGQVCVLVDASRVDRALGAAVEALAFSVGAGGAIELSVQRVDTCVTVALLGCRGRTDSMSATGQAVMGRTEADMLASMLLWRGWQRLFALHGGELQIDPIHPAVRLSLPIAEVA